MSQESALPLKAPRTHSIVALDSRHPAAATFAH